MDDHLDYVAEAISRAWRTAWSKLGLGVNVVLTIFSILFSWIILRPTDELIFGFIVLLTVFLFTLTLYVVWELRSIFLNISLVPDIESDRQHHQIKQAVLKIESDEAASIFCRAKLLRADNLYPYDKDYLVKIPCNRLEALEWQSQDKKEEEVCEVRIDPFEKTRKINVAQIQGSVAFTYCHGPRALEPLHGVFLIKIRVDGHSKGKEMRPHYFNGYLFVENVVLEGSVRSYRFFREGDWTKDEDIPEYYRKLKVIDE